MKKHHQGSSLSKQRLLAGVCVAGAAFALAADPAQAVIIYTETFASTSNQIQNYSGFTAYRNDGTDLSASTVDPLSVNLNNEFVFIGSASANKGDQYALISGAGTIDPSAYLNDLTISFTSNSTDDNPSDLGSMGWRVFATVGSTIYASDLIDRTTSETLKSVVVSSSVWNVWTGETDLTDGFDIANISSTPGALPSGSLSDVGVLAIDGAEGNNDRMRFRDITIEGTLVPEPTSAMLLGLGAMGLLARRRRSA